MSDEGLRAEVERLRTKVNDLEEWSYGVFSALQTVLPLLLRDHPQVAQAHQLFRQADARFEELLLNPERAEADAESASRLEPLKMLHRHLAVLGVWPGVDPQEAARPAIARHARGT